jgi:predicted dithiol-disulfide oxidoreductase (DUF899 family)
MGAHHEKQFPGEDDAYRSARDTLLAAEKELRLRTEEVAALRRTLPQGGAPGEDYAFIDCASDQAVKLSELFADGKNSLAIYSLMFAPGDDAPCPMCTSLLDGLDGQAGHINDRMNFAVAAKASTMELNDWAQQRGWNNLHLISSGGNSYNVDYFAEDEDGNQWPMMNVFVKDAGAAVTHSWGSELFLSPPEDGLHNRHVDQLWPLWNLFDLTPEGRGADWYPGLNYT